MHVHDLVPFQGVTFDLSHRIDKLSFGHEYPGMTNPLDRVNVPKFNTRNPQGLPGAYQYFLKVVHLSLGFCPLRAPNSAWEVYAWKALNPRMEEGMGHSGFVGRRRLAGS